MVASVVGLFSSFIPGLRLIDGQDLLTFANLEFSATNGIKATVGGTNLTSTPLASALNQIDTSTNSNTDGVILPNAIVGAQVIVNNNTANTITIFASAANPNNPSATGSPQADQIIAHASTALVAGNVGITLATGLVCEFVCFKAGIWKQSLSA